MSRVSITPIGKGDTGATADANATLESWNTNSTDISQVNVREEGLDERMFAAGTVMTDSDNTDVINVTLSNSGYPVSPDYQIGPLDFSDADAECIVRASCEIDVAGIAGTSDQAMIQFQLGYSVNGATWVLLGETQRIYKYNKATLNVEKTTGFPLVVNHTVAHRFVAAPSQSTLYFGLFTAETNASPSASYTIYGLHFFANIFRR